MMHCVGSMLLIVLIALTGVSSSAHAAVAEFFFSGFVVADPAIRDADEVERTLREKYLKLFGSKHGALHAVLNEVNWDEMNYYESVPDTTTKATTNRDFYGVFISINKAIVFEPDKYKVGSVDIDPTYRTYVLMAVNFFSLEERALVYSFPFLLDSVSNKKQTYQDVLARLMQKAADEMRTPDREGIGRSLAKGIESFFGGKGKSYEAIRREAAPIHRRDSSISETYAVSPPCDDCIQVVDRDREMPALNFRPDQFADFIQIVMTDRISKFRPIVFTAERQQRQRTAVSDTTGSVAATTIRLAAMNEDFGEICSRQFDSRGIQSVCVMVPPPKHTVKTGLRTLVTIERAAMDIAHIVTAVDYKIQSGDRTVNDSAAADRQFPLPRNGSLSDAKLAEAINSAVSTLDPSILP